MKKSLSSIFVVVPLVAALSACNVEYTKPIKIWNSSMDAAMAAEGYTYTRHTYSLIETAENNGSGYYHVIMKNGYEVWHVYPDGRDIFVGPQIYSVDATLDFERAREKAQDVYASEFGEKTGYEALRKAAEGKDHIRGTITYRD